LDFKVYRFVRYFIHVLLYYCAGLCCGLGTCYLSFGRKGGLFEFRVGFGVDVRYNCIYLGR
jgi:hypothetical protein